MHPRRGKSRPVRGGATAGTAAGGGGYSQLLVRVTGTHLPGGWLAPAWVWPGLSYSQLLVRGTCAPPLHRVDGVRGGLLPAAGTGHRWSPPRRSLSGGAGRGYSQLLVRVTWFTSSNRVWCRAAALLPAAGAGHRWSPPRRSLSGGAGRGYSQLLVRVTSHLLYSGGRGHRRLLPAAGAGHGRSPPWRRFQVVRGGATPSCSCGSRGTSCSRRSGFRARIGSPSPFR
jgi:hypothetical protein